MSDKEKVPKSTIGYYACGHQVSNKPCDKCQPGQPTMPDDWYKTFKSKGSPGTTDKVNL